MGDGRKLFENVSPATLILSDISPTRVSARRFYRPELDALRFLAFLLVLLHHGPKGTLALRELAAIGCSGLSLFFALSAYLITELLLQEREKTGTVDWPRFFVRRALRIWPLYYGTIACLGILYLAGHTNWITRTGLVAMPLFLSNWFMMRPGVDIGLLVVPLWSISLEEQFYLIWPPLMKWGSRRAVLLVSVGLILLGTLWLVILPNTREFWFDAPVQFSFFAVGALLALGTRHRKLSFSPRIRMLLLLAGALAFYAAEETGHLGRDLPVPGHPAIGYGSALLGTVFVFLAFLGFDRFPKPVLYLGKISYGLYVFHEAGIFLGRKLLSGQHSELLFALTVDILAFFLTLAAASLSYRYFEMPFLRLKQRYSVILSR